jgi:hypothetical protein
MGVANKRDAEFSADTRGSGRRVFDRITGSSRILNNLVHPVILSNLIPLILFIRAEIRVIRVRLFDTRQ